MARADDGYLEQRYRELGEERPNSWIAGEDDGPELARYLFLRSTWKRMSSGLDDALRSEPARALLEAGADQTTLRRLLQLTIGRVSTGFLYLVDEPDGTSWPDRFRDVEEDDPRWILIELPADADPDELPEGFGRPVGGLHESWGELDPSAQEGEGWS